MKVHFDTDFGGDPDDACALAMLLGMSDVEIVGITTTLEHEGQRAGCVDHVLALAGRVEIPVASGAEVTLTGQRFRPAWSDPRHWPSRPRPNRGPPSEALDLLASSIAAGATVIAIGGFTNLALLELERPGALAAVPVVAMAGSFGPARKGFPAWGPEMDFNTQVDTRAADIVTWVASLTLVPLSVAMHAWLRGDDLPRLRATGALGTLLADQSEAHRDDADLTALAGEHDGLPADLVNFHWDPVACAVATRWPKAIVEARRLTTDVDDQGRMRFVHDAAGPLHHVVTSIDGEGFSDHWLHAVAAANVPSARGRADVHRRPR